MRARRAAGQAGFIITLELVLIFSILGIGLLVGIVAVRNALFVYALKKQAQTVWVYDSTPAPAGPILLGPARDFDEHEAPRLFFIDRSMADLMAPEDTMQAEWVGKNYRAFIGVRDDRFTSRQRIFYRNSLVCGADQMDPQPCIVRAGNELGDNRAVGYVGVDGFDAQGNEVAATGQIAEGGGIGYLYPMQPGSPIGAMTLVPGPSYGIGRDVNPANAATGLPGALYREAIEACDPQEVRSVWTSQRVIDPTQGEPCEPLPGGVTVDAAKCPDGRDGDSLNDPCLPPADPRCVTTGTCSGSGLGCFSDADCTAGAFQCSLTPFDSCTTNANCLGSCTITGAGCSPSLPCPNAGACSITAVACTGGPGPGTCTGVCIRNNGTSNGATCTVDADCTANPYTTCAPQTCDSTPQTCNGYQGTCVAVAGGSCQLNNLICGCPLGWVDFGANCCPPGTTSQPTPGQCSIGDEGDVVEAVSVTAFNSVAWTTPFRVNLPPDPNDFYLLAPGGGEGAPGMPTGTPYDPSGPIDFGTPNDGVEGSPP